LLRSSDVNVRRAAAAALRNTQNRAAIPSLAQGALQDSDREVQYEAVIGLAEITGMNGDWAPTYGAFLKEPQRYVDHWRECAKAQK
jgi:HEAT repeat protein